jgi:alkaline phosphatase
MVTDSAAGITALVAGAKVPMGAICADLKADGSLDSLQSVFEIAEALGLATGVVTTTRLTHATPAAAFAHTMSRREEGLIALALLPDSGNPRLGNGIEVVLGGGREGFLPRETGDGRRADGRDLLRELRGAGYHLVDDAGDLRAAVASEEERVFGAFTTSHMSFEVDRAGGESGEPSLAEMTRAAITVLERNPRGFLLLVEGGRIDHALHANNGIRAVTDMLAFDEAIEVALERDPKETLTLITSDHDHTMVVAGYPGAEEDVFVQAGKDSDGIPYTAILFANGPSAGADLPDSLSRDLLENPEFQERAGVPLASETHGGMDVPLYAFGPERYLEMIRGSMENTEVFGILRAAIEER